MPKRLATYEACLDRFNRWVKEHLNADYSWSKEADCLGYFSTVEYAQHIGRRDWSSGLLKYVQNHMIDEHGNLPQPALLKNMWAYVPGWTAWAAYQGEAYQLSNRLLEQVLSFQCRTCGGLFGSIEGREQQQGEIDFDTTAIGGISFGRCGRVASCVKVADHLLRIIELQPNPKEQFFTRWHEPGGLLTNIEPDQSVLQWNASKQYYYKTGLLVMALSQAYAATGQEKYLDAAIAAYQNTVERARDLWRNTCGHKMCWAAVTLYAITGEKGYVEDACRISDHLVTLQQAEGAFAYPELFEYPPKPWGRLLGIGAQFALWIARTRDVLAALGR